jgi:hypothetical protein
VQRAVGVARLQQHPDVVGQPGVQQVRGGDLAGHRGEVQHPGGTHEHVEADLMDGRTAATRVQGGLDVRPGVGAHVPPGDVAGVTVADLLHVPRLGLAPGMEHPGEHRDRDVEDLRRVGHIGY